MYIASITCIEHPNSYILGDNPESSISYLLFSRSHTWLSSIPFCSHHHQHLAAILTFAKNKNRCSNILSYLTIPSILLKQVTSRWCEHTKQNICETLTMTEIRSSIDRRNFIPYYLQYCFHCE